MKTYANLLILVALSGALGLPLSNRLATHSIGTQCGQTLHVTESATIEYKLGEAFNDYEICPFVVRVNNAGSLSFALQASGFGNSGKLSVATLQAIQYFPHGTALQAGELADDAEPITLEGSIAIVTFSSFGGIGTGFSLNITKNGFSDSIFSPNSVDQIVASNSGEFRHPAEGELYSNYELSTFLVAPENFTTIDLGPGATVLSYIELGLERNCHDMVDIWSFSKSYELKGGWRHIRMLCKGDDGGLFPYADELALVTFLSDRDIRDSGFSVNYQRASEVENFKLEE